MVFILSNNVNLIAFIKGDNNQVSEYLHSNQISVYL